MSRSVNKRNLKALEQLAEALIKNQYKPTNLQSKKFQFTPEQLKILESGGTIELKFGGLIEKFQRSDFKNLYKEVTCVGEFVKAMTSDKSRILTKKINDYAMLKGLK